MLLNGKQIRDRLLDRSGEPKNWLVISPVLDWENQLNDGSASIDLRLGAIFRVPNRAQLEKLDPLDRAYEASKEQYMDEVFVPIGEKFILHPRQFALGQTLEWIHLPLGLGAYLIALYTRICNGVSIHAARRIRRRSAVAF